MGRCTILYFTGDGQILFQGAKGLVFKPEDARVFIVDRDGANEIDAAWQLMRDAIFLNSAGIVQIRIIGSDDLPIAEPLGVRMRRDLQDVATRILG